MGKPSVGDPGCDRERLGESLVRSVLADVEEGGPVCTAPGVRRWAEPTIDAERTDMDPGWVDVEQSLRIGGGVPRAGEQCGGGAQTGPDASPPRRGMPERAVVYNQRDEVEEHLDPWKRAPPGRIVGRAEDDIRFLSTCRASEVEGLSLIHI